MKTMSGKREHFKPTLVRTRKIIANKFRKLHNQRLNRERELERKYTPITNSIQNLFETKRKLSLEKTRLRNANQNDSENDLENVPNLDRANDFVPNIPVLNLNEHNENELPGFSDDDESYENQNRIAELPELPNDISLDDVINYDQTNGENVVRVRKNDKNKKRAQAVDIMINRGIKTEKNTPRFQKFKMKSKLKSHQPSVTQNLIESNVEDDNEMEGAVGGYDPINDEISNERMITPELVENDRIIMSPEDYDEAGNFIGDPEKRRKIEISPQRFSEKQKEQQQVRSQVRRSKRLNGKLRMRYDGMGLESDFIPYAHNIIYEYFDDPNELCDRLKLLVSSKSAGNSNHDQEINSIVEELRECGSIQ